MPTDQADIGGKTFRVGIVGSYGGLNLGDEAILHSIITQLRAEESVAITVFSRNPEDTLARHRVEKAVPVRNMTKDEVLPEIECLDLLIVGGGILFDAAAYDIPLRSLIPQRVEHMLVAGRCISGTHEAHSSYRVMSVSMATGQAAGVCAAASAKLGKTPRDVPFAEVQRELVRQGADIRQPALVG